MTNQLDVRPEAVHLSNPAELFSFTGFFPAALHFTGTRQTTGNFSLQFTQQ